METTVQTQQAIITRISPNEVEVRFGDGVVIDKVGIAEIMQERKRMCGDTPVGLLLIVPGDTELDVAIINTDHYRANQGSEHVIALAVVAGSLMSETLISLYRAYYPTTFRSEVFMKEEEARSWLRQRIGEATGGPG